MELIKYSPEEQARIELDRALPHAVVTLCAPLDRHKVEQDGPAQMLQRAMNELKERGRRARMIILATSMSTNAVTIDGYGYLTIVILCQWATIEDLEENQRRQMLAQGGPMPGRRA